MTRGYSAVVLAGGDGTRLRSLTWQLAGDARVLATRERARWQLASA